jgi:hypothetical protein
VSDDCEEEMNQDPIRARLDDLLYGQNVDYVPYFPDLFWDALRAVLDLCDDMRSKNVWALTAWADEIECDIASALGVSP